MFREKKYFLGIAFLIGALVSGSFYFGFFSGLENFFEDLLFSPRPINQDLVIVEIDNDSLQKIGQWPWSRSVFADALLELEKYHPKSVGIDVIFAETSRLGRADDLALVNALNQISYPVVLPIEAVPLIIEQGRPRAGEFLKTLPDIAKAKSVTLGHVNLILDADGVVRRFPLKIDSFGAFSYEVARKSGLTIPREDTLKDINRIVFTGETGSIRRVPFWRILEGDLEELLTNKVILIGATAADLHDEKTTPLSRGTQMSGVEIQANAVNMILAGYRLAPMNYWLNVLWILAAAFLAEAAFLVFKREFLPLLVNIILGIIYLILIVLFFNKGIAANLVHINFAWILSSASLLSYRYFVSEHGRREMKGLFSKYVSKDVLEEILKDPNKVKLGGEEKEVTVFFSDIRGFTTLSEKTTPTELVHILNEYFTLMTGEVLKHNGVLDKYIGDAIMAFWGAPIEDPNHADNALQASLGMIEKLKILNKEHRENSEPEIGMGIGLYTGPAIVGNVGSDMRFDYTVIGDTVNVASRLEGLNKEFKTQIIIGETTKNKLKGNYKFKSLGSVIVKGRKEPLNIYTIL